MRRPYFVVAVPIIAGLSGCPKPVHTLVRFDKLSDCPALTAASLVAHQNELGPRSTTHALECSLALLRRTRDQALSRSSLGSRIALHLAERSVEPDLRENLAAEGVRFAETALALGADGDGAVHYYLAANLGSVVRRHAARALESLPRLEAEITRSVALDSSLDDGGPLRLLGMLYLKAPPWPTGIGDGDKALQLLRQAAERFPRHPLNHLFYAEALWESEEDNAQDLARNQLTIGRQRLAEGDWGYSREPWLKEFAHFQDEITQAKE